MPNDIFFVSLVSLLLSLVPSISLCIMAGGLYIVVVVPSWSMIEVRVPADWNLSPNLPSLAFLAAILACDSSASFLDTVTVEDLAAARGPF